MRFGEVIQSTAQASKVVLYRDTGSGRICSALYLDGKALFREVDHVNYHEITGQFIFSLLCSRENKRLVDIHVVMGKMKQMRE